MTAPGKVFISYSTKADKDLARRLAGWLRANSFPVWLDEEDIPPGEPFEARIDAAIRECESAIFLISEPWLSGVYTRHEARKLGSSTCRLIPVVRFVGAVGQLPAHLDGRAPLEWFGDDVDPAPLFWRIYCGLRGERAGPAEEWAPKGQVLIQKYDAQRGSYAVAERPLPAEANPGAELLLLCDRSEQWGEVEPLLVDDMHRTLLLLGRSEEAAELFLRRIQRYLRNDPPRRIVCVTWSEPCPSQSERLWADLARAFGAKESALAVTVQQLLAHQNVVVLQQPAQRFENEALRGYFVHLLPQLVPDPGSTRFGLKIVQPLELPSPDTKRWLCRAWQTLTGTSSDTPRTDPESFANELRDKASPRLPVRDIPVFTPITRAHLEKFCRDRGLPEQNRRRFVDDVLRDARTSREILKNIERYYSSAELT